MALHAKMVGGVEGFTKGQPYEVLGFTGSTVVLLNDKKRLVHFPYASLYDESVWELEPEGSHPSTQPLLGRAHPQAQVQAAMGAAATKPAAPLAPAPAPIDTNSTSSAEKTG